MLLRTERCIVYPDRALTGAYTTRATARSARVASGCSTLAWESATAEPLRVLCVPKFVIFPAGYRCCLRPDITRGEGAQQLQGRVKSRNSGINSYDPKIGR